MKKGSTAIWVIIILVVVIGAVVFATNGGNTPQESDEMMQDDAMMEESHDDSMMMEEDKDGESMMEDGDAMMEEKMDEGDSMSKGPGSYEDYSSEKLAKASEGDLVLFFHANWCPTCRSLEANIQENATDIPSGVTILKANYDKEVDLKKKYGVTYQHALVQVDAQGNLVTKWQGSPTLASLLGQIK